MDRIEQLNRFYDILQELESKTGTRILAISDNHMDWPQQGVFFFFQPGEFRANGEQMRVVRVGIANPVAADRQSALWDRLREHRGTVSGKFAGGGNHRTSDFRYFVGSSLIARDRIDCSSWEKLDLANTVIRKKEHRLETEVSQIINNMPFLWIDTERSAKPEQLNQFIKRHAVSLLSNYHKKLICDPPSPNWLGNYCPNMAVRLSGLWNSRNVDTPCNLKFLDYLEKLTRLVA